MPARILGQPVNEEKWAEAKKEAAKSGQAGNFAVIMTIYKNMMHLGKSVDICGKIIKKLGVDNIKKRGYDNSSLRLVLAKGRLDEFRCGVCKALLFKGRCLSKSFIEVKCRSCGTFNINQVV